MDNKEQINEQTTRAENLAVEPAETPSFSIEQLQQRLSNVREKLESLGWTPRSPEESEVIQKESEKRFLAEIANIEQSLGKPLSEETKRELRKKHQEDITRDQEQYTARYSDLLRQERELIDSIENEKPDMQRAEEYWERTLEGENRITKPIDPNCEISIVVPAYNESPDRVMKLIESLKKQKDTVFEVIFVVNNDVPNDSDRSKKAIATNAQLMEYLRKDHGIPIHVIDKSSPGNEIPKCNVGKARNRGVAESSLRFREIGRNGIIIQTDADTWIEDEHFLSEVKSTMASPEIIGAAGGINLEWDPETKDPRERKELQRKINPLFLRKIAERFTEFLREPNKYGHFSTSFLGANMITKSFESAVIGGVPEIKGGEDGTFGSNLEAYGQKKGKKVIGKKHDLFITTSFRESDRTGSSLKKIFDSINPDKPEMVQNFFATTNPEETKEIELNQEYIDRLKVAIREKEGGSEYVDDFEKSMRYIRLKSE